MYSAASVQNEDINVAAVLDVVGGDISGFDLNIANSEILQVLYVKNLNESGQVEKVRVRCSYQRERVYFPAEFEQQFELQFPWDICPSSIDLNSFPWAIQDGSETGVCGDGTTDSQEECDDGNTVTEECDYGLAECTVCAADCTLQDGVTHVCGDGTTEGLGMNWRWCHGALIH